MKSDQLFFRFAKTFGAFCLLLASLCAHAQQFPKNRPWLSPMDMTTLRDIAQRAPMESDAQARKMSPAIIDFPMPGGAEEKMRLIEAPVMSAEIQAQYPEIRSYIVESVNDPKVFGRIAISPAGVEGLVFGTEGDIYIQPFEYGSRMHKVYYADPEDFPHLGNDALELTKTTHQHAPGELVHEHGRFKLANTGFNIGDKIRKIRVSILTDGEYSQKVGGATPTQASVLMAINAVFTGLNALYVRDMSVTLELTKHTIYLDPATDPFPNVGASNPSWLNESAKEHLAMNTNNTVPVSTYDVGHLFSARVAAGSGGGGASYLGNLGSSDLDINGTPAVFKAGVGSGVPDPQGSGWIFLLAHEFTHAFGANHTWSGSEGNCTPDQFGTAAAVEPGGGSTIVSYWDICESHKIPGACEASGNYYHSVSIQEVNALVNNLLGMMPQVLSTTATANQKPTVNANPCGGNVHLPKGTPFELDGSGNDADGNGTLTYNWEQMDRAPARMVPWTAGSLTTGPLFRSFQPSSTGNKRSFPSMANILDNNYNGPHVMNFGQTQWKGEVLPTVARDITMRLTVRDNNTVSGGVEFSEVVLKVNGTAGPFVVNAPNGGENVVIGGNTNITWNIAGTDQAPINCANVNILLTTDGGKTYTTLAADTPNDGEEMVTIPANLMASTTARVRVESASTTCIKFFDVSNANFTLAPMMAKAGEARKGTAVPNLYIRDVYAHENSGQAQVRVFLTEPALSDVTVEYATANATALAGVHYQAKSGTVIIPGGQLGAVIAIPLTDDINAAPPTYFEVSLSNPSGATLLNNRADVTILDDDTDQLCNATLSYQITGVACNPGVDPSNPLDDTYTFTVVLSESSGNSPGFTLGCDPTTYQYGQPVTLDVGTGIGRYWELANDLLNPNCYIALAPGANLVADYAVNNAGNILIVTDVIGKSDVLTIDQNGAGIRFDAAGRLYSLNGGPATCFPVTVPLAGLAGITINASEGNDNLNVGAFAAAMPSLTLNGGTGNDNVNFNGDITFATNANLDVDLQNDAVSPGEDGATVNSGVNLVLSGAGAATVKVSRDVLVNDGGSIETVNGDLTVEANQQAVPTAGNFKGIENIGTLKTSGTGALAAKGKGGNDAAGFQQGIHVVNGGQISGGSGTVTVQGTGGAGTGNGNDGVVVQGTNSRITSSGGAVSVTGQGGGSGTAADNFGVHLTVAAEITAGGSGTVTVQGTGGASTGNNNYGVAVRNNARITSSGGTVSITGIEGGGPSGIGFFNQANGSVSTAANGGNISIRANSMSIGADISTNAAGSVTLLPYTNGTSIDLGSASDPIGGPLGLSDTELDRVATSTLNIGNANTGDITVSAAITRSASTVLNLTSGDKVNLNASSLNTAGGNVTIDAVNGTNPTAAGTDVNAGSGTLDFATGDKLNIAINSNTVDAGYSQLNVTGKVDISGVDLVLSGSHVPVGGQTFTIVNHDLVDAVTGTFNGLPQGATLSNFLGSGLSAILSYTGGDGNDVVITVNCPITFNTSTMPSVCLGTTGQITFSGASGGTAPYQYSINDGGAFQSGATFSNLAPGTYRAKVKDANGCESVSSNVQVAATGDVSLPNIVCPANKIQGTDPGQCGALITYNPATATDNCTANPLVERTSGPASGSIFPKGLTTVIWRATDGNGLTKTCSFRVIIMDTQAPTMTCPNPIAANATAGQCSATVTYANPTFTDNCAPLSGTSVRVSGLASGATFPIGTSNVVFQATDAAGRTNRCTLTVIVTDNQPMVINCPPPVTVTGNGTPCKATVYYNAPTATDNCGINGVYLLSGLASGSQFPLGTNTVIWRAISTGGQTADCFFSVTVNCATARGNETENRDNTQQEETNTDSPGHWDFSIAPNPAKAEVYINLIAPNQRIAHSTNLNIFNVQGRLIWSQKVESTGEQAWRVDASGWAPGVYIVALRGEGTVLTKRLTIFD